MPQALTEAREPVNAMYYGEGGTGKSTALASMANLGKIWICSAESGIKSRPLRQLGIDVGNIEVFGPPNDEITHESIEEEWLRIREELNEDPDAYAGVGLDSITEIHKVLLDGAVRERVATKARRGEEVNRFFVTQDDYGVMTKEVRDLLRKFRDLPCHFAITALQRRDQDPDSSVVYRPSVTPALQDDLNLWVDITCHTSVELVGDDEEYRGLFRTHGTFRGKDRLGAMPKWLVDPTFERIVAYVGDELNADTDPVTKAAKAKRAKITESADTDKTETEEKETK